MGQYGLEFATTGFVVSRAESTVLYLQASYGVDGVCFGLLLTSKWRTGGGCVADSLPGFGDIYLGTLARHLHFDVRWDRCPAFSKA